MASESELEVEIVGAECPCDLWARFVLMVDNNKEPIEQDEPGKNSGDHELILRHWLERVIDKTLTTEIRIGRVYDCMPNNPVGFVEDF